MGRGGRSKQLVPLNSQSLLRPLVAQGEPKFEEVRLRGGDVGMVGWELSAGMHHTEELVLAVGCLPKR